MRKIIKKNPRIKLAAFLFNPHIYKIALAKVNVFIINAMIEKNHF